LMYSTSNCPIAFVWKANSCQMKSPYHTNRTHTGARAHQPHTSKLLPCYIRWYQFQIAQGLLFSMFLMTQQKPSLLLPKHLVSGSHHVPYDLRVCHVCM
jgi:hypothetical protein